MCGYPVAEQVSQKVAFLCEADMGGSGCGLGVGVGVSVPSREAGGCFLRKSPCESQSLGLSQLPQGRALWSPIPSGQQRFPTLNRSQSGWEEAERIGSALSSDPVFQINYTCPLPEISAQTRPLPCFLSLCSCCALSFLAKLSAFRRGSPGGGLAKATGKPWPFPFWIPPPPQATSPLI